MSNALPTEIDMQIKNYSKKIDFYTSEYTVEILSQKVERGDYIVPDYQREYVWDEPRKCKFIESIIIGLPIPFLFFWQSDETGRLEIVDGSQRLRTIEEYFNNRLRLEGLERLGLLNGTYFKDLPLSQQRKILNKSIRGIILSEDTDIEARVDLFERINTGSKVAEPVEVRRGALRGPFMDFINRLSKNELFIKLAPISANQKKKREHEELVSRFFAYSDGLDGYRDNVSPFIFNYIKKMNNEFSIDSSLYKEYENRFIQMLNFVDENFILGFKKTEKAKTTPRARFESIAIGSYLALKEKTNLNLTREKINEIIQSNAFQFETRSDGANAVKKLKGRINFIKDALLERG